MLSKAGENNAAIFLPTNLVIYWMERPSHGVGILGRKISFKEENQIFTTSALSLNYIVGRFSAFETEM